MNITFNEKYLKKLNKKIKHIICKSDTITLRQADLENKDFSIFNFKTHNYKIHMLYKYCIKSKKHRFIKKYCHYLLKSFSAYNLSSYFEYCK